MALSLGTPIDVVGSLVDLNGGKLPEDAALTLVFHSLNLKGWPGVHELVEALAETRGLDLHYVDAAGHNAITKAVIHYFDLPDSRQVNNDAFRLLEYLTGQTVTTKPTPQGLDALDHVLLGILELPHTVRAGIPFLRHLIDHGSPVEHSHRQVAAMLADKDPERHARLLEALPELRS